jgi:circadian clock protein KaiC
MEGRLETGIPGLDEMTGGGWLVPTSILVAGAPGTGKTTFAVQSLFAGARHGQMGVYFSGISEPGWVVQHFLKDYGFYDQSLVDSGKVVFIDVGNAVRKSAQDAIDQIHHEVERLAPTRIVIDPVTVLRTAIETEKVYREALHDLTTFMKSLNCVLILTSESDYDERRPGVEGHMVDSIIVLSHPKEGHVRRGYLEVVKMRGSAHMSGEQSADLSKNGLVVHPGLR